MNKFLYGIPWILSLWYIFTNKRIILNTSLPLLFENTGNKPGTEMRHIGQDKWENSLLKLCLTLTLSVSFSRSLPVFTVIYKSHRVREAQCSLCTGSRKPVWFVHWPSHGGLFGCFGFYSENWWLLNFVFLSVLLLETLLSGCHWA